MISKEEVKKLAGLARIGVSDEEADKLRGEMDTILEYVKVVSQFQVDEHTSNENTSDQVEIGQLRNIWREDENPTESGTYSKEIIAEFPEKEGDYLKVKKILG